jgi:uncharacterized membrane protein
MVIHASPKYLFATILVFAMALRLLLLGEHSLWVDELFSIRYGRLGVPALWADVSAIDNHPPLYYLLLHFWVLAFGESEFAVRSLSVLFGVLTVGIAYRLGVSMYNPRTALIAALILAVASYPIYWSQEARMYSLLPLLAGISVYFMWQLMRAGGVRHTLAYLISTVALLYTHSYGLFIVAAQNGYLVLLWYLGIHRNLQMKPGKWIGVQLCVLLLFLPWLWVLAARVTQLHADGFWVAQPSLMTVAGTFSEFAGSNPLLRFVLLLLVFYAASLSGIRVAKAAKGAPRRDALQSMEFRATVLLLACLMVPVLLPFVLSQFTTPIYVNRAVGVVYVFFVLLVADGIAKITIPALSRATLVGVVLLLLGNLAAKGYVHGGAPKYRELVDYVRTHVPPRALIVTCDDGQMSWPFAHYAAATGLPSPVIEANDVSIADGSWPGIWNQPEVWLVTLEQRTEAMNRCRKLPELLQTRYPEMRVLDLPLRAFGIRVYTGPPTD